MTDFSRVVYHGRMSDVIDQAIKAAGGLTKLGAAIGVAPQVVANWRVRGVPVERCAEVEQASKNAVRRWDLRPDDWHLIWPELIGAEGAPKVEVSDAA